MNLSGLTCIQAACAVTGKRYDDGEGPYLGFARGADVYGADLPAGDYARIARAAIFAATQNPAPHLFLRGVRLHLDRIGLDVPPCPDDTLGDRIMGAADANTTRIMLAKQAEVTHGGPSAEVTRSAARLGLAIKKTFGRRNFCPSHLGFMGIGLFMDIVAAGHAAHAAHTLEHMLERA